ncbi:MAG: O-antigen ligase family protein [Gemmatimonadota bacterium]
MLRRRWPIQGTGTGAADERARSMNEGLLHRLRDPLWLAGTALATVAAALVLAHRPWLAMGATFGGFLFLVLLVRPLVLIGVLLAIGAVDLSFITGGPKALLPGLGGLDMNGIRLVGLVGGVTLLTVLDRRLQRWVFGPEGRWYVLFLAFAGATLAFSPSPVEGLRLLFKLAYPFVVFIAVCGLVRTRADLERIGDGVLLAAAVLTLVVVPIHVMSGGYVVDARGDLHVNAPGLDHNPFAFYLLAMLLLAYARYSARGEVRYLVLGGVFAVWIALTLSRTTLGGAIAGLVGAGAFGAVVARNYRALFGTAVLAAAVAVPLLPAALERSFGYIPSLGELWSLARDPAALYGEIYWAGRESFWPIVFRAFLTSPIIGLGLGASTAVLVRNTPSSWADVVHNEYLRLATDTGVIGVALFAVAILVWWRAVVRAARTGDELAREYALPAFAGIVAWAVVSFPGNAFDYYAPFTQYIGFFCAGAVAAARLAREEGEEGEEAHGAA